MSFKFFNMPSNVTFHNEDEKNLVQGLADLGIQRLYQVHVANKEAGATTANHNKMFAGFDATEDYSGDSKTILNGLLTYACQAAGISNDPETLKKLAHKKNTVFSEKFFGIVDQALPVVLASTVNYAFMNVSETRHVGWGDTAHFKVPSKDIFYVNSLGLGNKHGAIQRVYSEDIIVNPTMKEVTVALDWYQIVAGEYDLGDFMYRVGVAYATDISKLAYSKLDGSYASLPAARKEAGFTDAKWVGLGQKIKAANGNLPVYAMGSLLALQSVIPSNDYLKMELSEQYSLMGYLTRYKGINVLEIPQVITPGTVNTTLTFGIDDTRIYFMGMADRPVKIVFEGEAITSQTDMTESADGQMVVTVKQKYDATVVSSNFYGIMDLDA